MVPRLSRARSAPVNTATMPGDASAAAVSIDRMRACACVDRTITACVWPGTFTSLWKRPSPRKSR
jgi:hypothetical protein